MRAALDAIFLVAAELGEFVRRRRLVVGPNNTLAALDEFSAEIDHVEQELRAMLPSFDNLSESGVEFRFDRVADIRAKLAGRAARLRESAGSSADLHRRQRRDLSHTLAWIRELTSMIRLAKQTGAPASRAEELLAQIAVAAEDRSDSPPKS